MKRLEAVFQKLFAAGLKLEPSKCFFFREEIEYLGHVVSGKGISTNPKKVEAVANGPHLKQCMMSDPSLVLLGTREGLSKTLVKLLNLLEK